MEQCLPWIGYRLRYQNSICAFQMLILLGWGVYAEEIQSEEEVRQPCTYSRHSCPKSQLVKTVVYCCTLETLCTGLCSPLQTFISEEPAGGPVHGVVQGCRHSFLKSQLTDIGMLVYLGDLVHWVVQGATASRAGKSQPTVLPQ